MALTQNRSVSVSMAFLGIACPAGTEKSLATPGRGLIVFGANRYPYRMRIQVSGSPLNYYTNSAQCLPENIDVNSFVFLS